MWGRREWRGNDCTRRSFAFGIYEDGKLNEQVQVADIRLTEKRLRMFVQINIIFVNAIENIEVKWILSLTTYSLF